MIDGTLRAAIKYNDVVLNVQTTSHTDLTDRDVEDQHPMSAITGLENALTAKADAADLSAVATSGDYDDLTDKPDLSVYAQSADLSAVATSGSYTDLTGKPTIPTAVSQLTNDSGFLTLDTLPIWDGTVI